MGIILPTYGDYNQPLQGSRQKQPVSSSIIRVLKRCSVGFFKTETPPLCFLVTHPSLHENKSPCKVTISILFFSFHPKQPALWVISECRFLFFGLLRTGTAAWYLFFTQLPDPSLPRMANFLLQVICCFTAFIQRPRKQCFRKHVWKHNEHCFTLHYIPSLWSLG